jgi:hypothetical protein
MQKEKKSKNNDSRHQTWNRHNGSSTRMKDPGIKEERVRRKGTLKLEQQDVL